MIQDVLGTIGLWAVAIALEGTFTYFVAKHEIKKLGM